MTIRRVARPDGDLVVEDVGRGPAVVLMHGWTLDRRMWAPQRDALEGLYRVLALDRRGSGSSKAPPGLDHETADLLALLDQLDIDACALVGMSQAGRVALRFAQAHPERVWALVLQSAPLDGFVPGPTLAEAIPVEDYRAMATSGRLPAMRRAWLDHPVMRICDGAHLALIDAMLEAYDGRDLTAAPAAGPAPDLASLLSTIDVPALVLTGEHDTGWLQLVADAMAYGLPRATRAKVPGGGHLSNLTHTNAFNATLTAFLGPHAPYLDLSEPTCPFPSFPPPSSAPIHSPTG